MARDRTIVNFGVARAKSGEKKTSGGHVLRILNGLVGFDAAVWNSEGDAKTW